MLIQLKKDVAPILAQVVGRPPEDIVQLLEVPKDLQHGHLAFPVFSMAKELRQAPPQIAQSVASQLQSKSIPGVKSVQAISGFVNLTFDDFHVQKVLAQSVIGSVSPWIGGSTHGAGQKIIIEYSSPNVAKPMHVGHLRATVIGQAIKNLALTQGYDVIGLNHLGDWGVQFGKLAWAYQTWAHEYDFTKDPFKSLLAIYVRFHDEAEKNPELEKLGSQTFLRLEAKDPEVVALWQKFVDITLENNQKIYDLLGVHHEMVRGESFYSDRMPSLEKLLEERGLLVESEGAMVVHLDEYKMPPCLIRKSDGGSLYATRDLASAIYRFEELKAQSCYYVVAQDQSLHFEQVFAVLKKLKFEWAENCKHIPFGLYRFKDQSKISTRKGNVVLLEDILNRAIELTRTIIAEKNPDLANVETVAQQVGIGAVIFNDLVNDRVRNVDFDWDQVLDFNGTTGPYVQYSQVRCRSLIKKYGREIHAEMPEALIAPHERMLIRLLLNYADILAKSWESQKPSMLAQYLIDVAQAFGSFYQNHRILGEAPNVESSRMTVVAITQKILEEGLRVLSIQSPEAM